jgi:hypothetical protein
MEHPSAHRSDVQIRDEALARIAALPDEAGTGVMVDVTRGVVRLDGEVPDASGARAVEAAARAVGGVRDVENHVVARRGIVESVVDTFTGGGDGIQEHSGVGAMGATRDSSHDPAPAAGGAIGTAPRR